VTIFSLFLTTSYVPLRGVTGIKLLPTHHDEGATIATEWYAA
jgi:hypothetical protein